MRVSIKSSNFHENTVDYQNSQDSASGTDALAFDVVTKNLNTQNPTNGADVLMFCIPTEDHKTNDFAAGSDAL